MARHGSGIGKAVTTINTNSNSNVIPRDGGPLSYFLGEDDSTDDEDTTVNPDSIITNTTPRHRQYLQSQIRFHLEIYS